MKIDKKAKYSKTHEWVREEGESAEIYTRLAKSALLFEEGKAGLRRDPELLMTSNWQIKNNPNALWAKRYDPELVIDLATLTGAA